MQTESRGLFGRRTTYDNPWAPGATDKSFRDLTKVLRTGEMGAIPTEQETRQDLPLAEVRRFRFGWKRLLLLLLASVVAASAAAASAVGVGCW